MKISTDELNFVNGAEAKTFSISRSEEGMHVTTWRRLLIRIEPRAQRFNHSVELTASNVWRETVGAISSMHVSVY